MAAAQSTKDHARIRESTKARGGHPATVTATNEKDQAGLLRIDFPGYSGEETLERISWNDFFQKFVEKNLSFVYQQETETGDTSRFCKFVSAEDNSH